MQMSVIIQNLMGEKSDKKSFSYEEQLKAPASCNKWIFRFFSSIP